MMTAAANLIRARQLVSAGQHAEASTLCGELLEREPANVDALHLLAQLARYARQHDLAAGLLERAVHERPENPTLWMDLGAARLELDEIAAAKEAFEAVLKVDERSLDARLNLAAVAVREERYGEAERWCRQAVLVAGHLPHVHVSLGNVYREQGDTRRAMAAYERALELDPACNAARWHMAPCHLLKGDFERGWPAYELRSTVGDANIDCYPFPRWDGGPLRGKTLLVHAEQGVGDEILLASCYDDLRERAAHLVFVCEPRLEALFRRSFPWATVVGHRRRIDRAPAEVHDRVDVQLEAGSLPLFLRRRLEDFPDRRRFLAADSKKVRAWQDRFRQLDSELNGGGLTASGPIVGISWHAGGKPSEYRRRSTTLGQWTEVLRTPGVTWVNVQYGDVTEELADVARACGATVHDVDGGDPLVDLDGFAAKLAALDLVITVGNTTAHMAGALGVPCWTVLPLVPTWRWLSRGKRMPWYPDMRLYRQDASRDWNTVIERVGHDLRLLADERNSVCPASTSDARPLPAININREGLSRQKLVERSEDIPAALAEVYRRQQQGDLAGAEQVCRTILVRSPRHEHALYLLGALARQTGRLKLAIDSISRSLAVRESAVVRLELAHSLAADEKLPAAVSECRRVLELKPGFAEAQLALASFLLRQGETHEAEACYRAAAAADPAAADALLALARLLQSQGRTREAIATYTAALERQPSYAKAASGLGTALLEAGRRDHAIAAFQRAVAIDPSYAAAWNNLGRAQQDSGLAADALASYRRALGMLPTFETHFNLGTLHLEMGDVAAAIDQLEAAQQLRPDCGEVRKILEKACERSNKVTNRLAG